MDVTLIFLKRDFETGEFVQDGSHVFMNDDMASRGDLRAQRRGERWVAKAPENHRYEIVRQ